MPKSKKHSKSEHLAEYHDVNSDSFSSLAAIAAAIWFIGVVVVLTSAIMSSLITALPFPTPTISPTPTSLIGYAVINSEVQSDGTQKSTVSLSIDSIGMGQLVLTIPSSMELGSTDIVRLSIFPDSNLTKLVDISIPTQNTDTLPQPFQFTDNIELYPIMAAELSGVGFDITSNNQPEKIIFTDKPTEWIWTIKAKDEGPQLLVLQISIPAVVDGIEQPISSPLKNIPAEIKVTKSFDKRVGDSLSYLIPSLIGLIGVLLGIYVNSQVKERERKIVELEKQVSKETIEKQELGQEINRLKSIPKWQFWRR